MSRHFEMKKVVFYPAPGPYAVLLENRKGRRRSKAVEFADPHAALTWAIANRSSFVYFLTPDPAKN